MSTLRVGSLYYAGGPVSLATQALASTTCRAWACFDGSGTVSFRGSFGVESVTDNGTGDYTINIVPLRNENYGFFLETGGASSAYAHRSIEDATARTASSIRVYTLTTAGVFVDPLFVSCAFYHTNF